MAANAAVDLNTLANLEAYLGIASGSPVEPLLQTLLTAASQYISSYCNRQFILGPVTEVRNGGGNSFMMFGEYPVQTITSVFINGRPVPAATPPSFTAAAVQSGYMFTRFKLSLFGYLFYSGNANVYLQYTAGFDPALPIGAPGGIPADLAEAAVELAALKFKQKDRIGVTGTESIDGQSVTFGDIAMSAATKDVLRNYKKVIQITPS